MLCNDSRAADFPPARHPLRSVPYSTLPTPSAARLSSCPCFPLALPCLLQLLLSLSDPSFICPQSIFLHYK